MPQAVAFAVKICPQIDAYRGNTQQMETNFLHLTSVALQYPSLKDKGAFGVAELIESQRKQQLATPAVGKTKIGKGSPGVAETNYNESIYNHKGATRFTR